MSPTVVPASGQTDQGMRGTVTGVTPGPTTVTGVTSLPRWRMCAIWPSAWSVLKTVWSPDFELL